MTFGILTIPLNLLKQYKLHRKKHKGTALRRPFVMPICLENVTKTPFLCLDFVKNRSFICLDFVKSVSLHVL